MPNPRTGIQSVSKGEKSKLAIRVTDPELTVGVKVGPFWLKKGEVRVGSNFIPGAFPL